MEENGSYPPLVAKQPKRIWEKVSMKSQFPFRSEFEESLNIYPNKFISLKLEGFLGLLGALPILVVMVYRIKRFYVSRGTIKGYENLFT